MICFQYRTSNIIKHGIESGGGLSHVRNKLRSTIFGEEIALDLLVVEVVFDPILLVSFTDDAASEDLNWAKYTAKSDHSNHIPSLLNFLLKNYYSSLILNQVTLCPNFSMFNLEGLNPLIGIVSKTFDIDSLLKISFL